MSQEGPQHSTVEMLVSMRARGYTYAQIEAETSIDAAWAATQINAYLFENYGATSVAEQRMLQMRRLETIIGALWEQVIEQGDFLTEGKQTKNLLDTLNMITELLDLKKDRVKDEVVQLTRAQTELVHLVMSEVRVRMLESLMAVVAGIEPKGSAEEVKAAIRARIGAEFSTMFAEATERAIEAKGSQTTTVALGEAPHGEQRISD